MKSLTEITAIMNQYASEVGNREELIAYAEKLGPAVAAYYLWDDMLYGTLNEEEILTYFVSIGIEVSK